MIVIEVLNSGDCADCGNYHEDLVESFCPGCAEYHEIPIPVDKSNIIEIYNNPGINVNFYRAMRIAEKEGNNILLINEDSKKSK